MYRVPPAHAQVIDPPVLDRLTLQICTSTSIQKTHQILKFQSPENLQIVRNTSQLQSNQSTPLLEDLLFVQIGQYRILIVQLQPATSYPLISVLALIAYRQNVLNC